MNIINFAGDFKYLLYLIIEEICLLFTYNKQPT